KAIWPPSQIPSGNTSRNGLRHTGLASCGWIHDDFPAAIAMDPPAGDSATGPDDKRTPRPAEMRRRTRGTGAGREEPAPDERNRCRVSDPEGGIDQLEIGELRVFPGLRVLRGLRRPVAGTVARPAGGLPGRGRRAGPALLRTHLGGDAHGARVRGHILDDHGIGPDRGVVADDDGPEDLRPGAD